MGFMGSRKLSSFDGCWVGRHHIVLHGWHCDSVRATHGLPGEVFTWKMTLGYGGPGSTLWWSMWKVVTRDTCVVHVCHVIRLFPLQGDYWFESPRHPRIWVKLVRWYHSVEVLFYYVHMRFMIIFNYGYMVVKNDDSKNGCFVYLACLAYVANLLLLINLTWLITCLKVISSRC
jgi:hypothetical protein